MTPNTAKLLRYLCLTFSAATLIAAGAMMIFIDDKSVGIFAVLIAAVLARILVIDVAGWLEQRGDAPGGKSDS